MIYTDKYVLIAPMKCASNSVQNYFTESLGWSFHPFLGHSPYIPENLKDREVIMLIRNPYVRLISLWQYSSRTDPNFKDNPLDFKGFTLYYIKLRSKFEHFNFHAYVPLEAKHFASNVRCAFKTLKEYKSICNPKNLIRSESLEEDFKNIGIEVDLPVLNSSSKNSEQLLNLYTPEILNQCYFLKEDALEFGYDVL